MNDNIHFMKNGAVTETAAPSYSVWSLRNTDVFTQKTAGWFASALCSSAELCGFTRQYLYRLIVSRLARAEVIISGALTSIDVL